MQIKEDGLQSMMVDTVEATITSMTDLVEFQSTFKIWIKTIDLWNQWLKITLLKEEHQEQRLKVVENLMESFI